MNLTLKVEEQGIKNKMHQLEKGVEHREIMRSNIVRQSFEQINGQNEMQLKNKAEQSPNNTYYAMLQPER